MSLVFATKNFEVLVREGTERSLLLVRPLRPFPRPPPPLELSGHPFFQFFSLKKIPSGPPLSGPTSK